MSGGWVVRHLNVGTSPATGQRFRRIAWWFGGEDYSQVSGALEDPRVVVYPTKAACLAALRRRFASVPWASRHGFTPQRLADARAEAEALRYKADTES